MGRELVAVLLGFGLVLPSLVTSLMWVRRMRAWEQYRRAVAEAGESAEGSGVDAPTRPPRPTLGRAAYQLVFQVALVVALVGMYSAGLWTPATVGLEGELSWVTCFLAGIAVYIGIATLAGMIYRAIWGPRAMEQGTYATMRLLWPRSRAGKAMTLASLGINPFTEELIHRGIIIFAFSHLVGAPVAILTGLVVCVVMHLYQGGRAILWHTIFFAASVGLLFSPYGLAGAIGSHLAADLWPALGMRDLLERERDRRRLAHLEKLRRQGMGQG